MFGFFRSNPEVLVAGAGPVGLCAALSLARRGIQVAIIDSEWRGATHSYALALHSRSLELLAELGLADTVLEKARRVRRIGFYEGGERRASLDLGQVPTEFPFIAILAQSDFEDILERALADAGVKVHYSHRLARIEPGADSVTVEIHRLGKESMGYGVAQMETVVEGSERACIPLLLGADGHDSLVRKQLKIPFEPVRPADHFAVFEFNAAGQLPNEVCVVMDPKTTNVLWPMKHDFYRWSFMLQDRTADSESRTKDRLLVDVGPYHLPHLEQKVLDTFLLQRAPWFAGGVGRITWRTEVRFEYRLASAFGKGRVWLAGDAAHMAGPVGIQSMNVGLREAHALCRAFSKVLKGDSAEKVLGRYNDQRLSEWKALLGLGQPVVASHDAAPWVTDHAERLISCIPASGAHLSALLGHLGLSLPN